MPFLRQIFAGLLLSGSFATVYGQIPEAKEFERVTLATNLTQPMGMAFLPGGKIMLAERQGTLKIYKPDTKTTVTAGKLAARADGENGLLGLALDPAFQANGWVYFYYQNTDGHNRLSRLTVKGDSLTLGSEKILLEVINEGGGHVGGNLHFGPDGNLYLSTGDNTSWQNWLDEDLPGNDAMRTSGNTMDLRGKIIRIKPKPLADGVAGPTPGIGATYDIPVGNLFPTAGGIQGRKEIFAMGFKQPFRFSIDPTNNWLYVGDVGPDFDKYGATGFEEVNIIKQAGNFGWPAFIGPLANKDPKTGTFYDPANPRNLSKNNTGSQQLPVTNAPWLWYVNHWFNNTDHCSTQFTAVGCDDKGAAMAGPVYHYSAAVTSPGKLPGVLDGHFFWWDFQRLKIFGAKPGVNGAQPQVYVFPTGFDANSLIDMQLGPDHHLYIILYGTNSFTPGTVGGLYRIDYLGSDTRVGKPVQIGGKNLEIRRVSGGFQVSMPAKGDITISNSRGEVIHRHRSPGGRVENIDLTGLRQGIFFLKIKGAARNESHKLIWP